VNISFAKAGLYYRTVRHLRPEQITHRVRLRTKKLAYHRWPRYFERRWRPASTPSVRWPADFVALDRQLPPMCPDPASNAQGTFEFLGGRHDLGQPIVWKAADAPQLWRYNLHYWEWAHAFAAHPDRSWARDEFVRLWRSWRSGTTVGSWDEWSPYVVSLRAWTFCNLFDPLVRGSDAEHDFVRDLVMHASFLTANLELDVGGNHLLKNLKALAGLGVFLGDDPMLANALDRLVTQLDVQILADGGHYERSPSYHCQVLGDLIDVSNLLRAVDHPPIGRLDDAIAAMRSWLGIMLMPDGDVPLFNDCVLVGMDRIDLLEPTPRPADRLVVLRETGYAVMRPDERIHLVADVGDPCPPDLPAHAHADCLSFELAVDGERIIVDSGVTTYEPGPQRDWERSTAAHNTIEIDGQDQTEVWGSFRAGRRARATIHEATESEDGSLRVRASHDGYRYLAGRPEHVRTFVTSPGSILIADEVRGGAQHKTTWRLHFAQGVSCSAIKDGAAIGPAVIHLSGSGDPALLGAHNAEAVSADPIQRACRQLIVRSDGQAWLACRIQVSTSQ
jgi:uncharacterized heparinase superfamily protein